MEAGMSPSVESNDEQVNLLLWTDMFIYHGLIF